MDERNKVRLGFEQCIEKNSAAIRNAEPERCARLRVEVDEEDASAALNEGTSEAHRRCRLPHSTVRVHARYRFALPS